MIIITKKHLANFSIVFILLMIIWSLVGRSFYRDFKGIRYTIANVYKLEPLGKNGVAIYYEYKVLGKKYYGKISGILEGNKKIIYINYMKNDFSNSDMIEFVRVPDCLQYSDAPADGWDKLPDENICDSLNR